MKEEIKDILREHVEKHEYPVDASEIWAGMQSEIKKDEKKSKLRLLGIFFSFGLVLLLAFQFVNFEFGDTNQISDNNQVENNSSNSKAISNVDKHNENELSIPKTELKQEKQKINKLAETEEANTLQQVNTNSTINTNNSSSQIFSGGEINNSQTNFFNKVNSDELNLISDIKDNESIQNGANGLQFFGQSILKNNSEEQKEIDSKTDLETDRAQAFEMRPSLEAFSLISGISKTGLTQLAPRNNPIDETSFTLVDVKKTRNSQTTLSIIAGGGLYSKGLIAHNEVNSGYVNEREKYENPLELISVQALITVPVVGKFNVSSGINYLLFNEEFNWNGSYFIDENGEHITTVPDNLIGENYYQEVQHSLQNYNQTKLISIPFLVGYTSTQNRFSYGIKAGVNLNVRTTSTGKALSMNLIPTSIQNFNQEFGVGIQTKLELGYRLSPGLELMGDISWMQLQLNEDLLSQRIRTYTIGLGLRKRI